MGGTAVRNVYTSAAYSVHMTRRTTIQIDEQLLARAKRALGQESERP